MGTSRHDEGPGRHKLSGALPLPISGKRRCFPPVGPGRPESTRLQSGSSHGASGCPYGPFSQQREVRDPLSLTVPGGLLLCRGGKENALGTSLGAPYRPQHGATLSRHHPKVTRPSPIRPTARGGLRSAPGRRPWPWCADPHGRVCPKRGVSLTRTRAGQRIRTPLGPPSTPPHRIRPSRLPPGHWRRSPPLQWPLCTRPDSWSDRAGDRGRGARPVQRRARRSGLVGPGGPTRKTLLQDMREYNWISSPAPDTPRGPHPAPSGPVPGASRPPRPSASGR